MKRVPPPNTKRIPPPPVPKLAVKTLQQKPISQNISQQNQQQADNPANQTGSFPIQKETQPTIQRQGKNVDEKDKKQKIQQGVQNTQTQNKQMLDNVQQQQVISNNEQVKMVEPKIAPMMKGVPPPPKSRNAVSQDKKRVNPPKIPPPNLISRMQQTPQKDQNLTNNVTDTIGSNQNPINQPHQQKTQGQKIYAESQVKNINQNIGVQNQGRNELIKDQQSPVKIVPPPSFKPGNKKAPIKVKPPIKPPSTIKNVQTPQIQPLNQQNQQISIKNNEPKTQQKQNKPEKAKIDKKYLLLQSKNKPEQEISSVQKDENPQKTRDDKNTNQNKEKDLNKKQYQQSEIKQREQNGQPKQYNELQQKLRRLQELRSKMDQSSEEQYSHQQEDQIQQEAELQISQNQSQEQQKNDDQILILGQRNIETQIQPLYEENEDMKVNFQQFGIGETNYEQMEIKQENPDIVDQKQTPNIQPQITVQNQTQQNSPDTSSPEEQSISNVPLPAQTVYQSNLSVQQSQRQYLPDELSISPLNSESSLSKHRQFPHDSTNNVHHADKYHSQANFDKLKTNDKNIQQDQINEKLQEAAISQKTQNQLSKSRNRPSKNQHYHQIKDQSIQTVYDKNSFDNDQQNFKENQHPKINLQNNQVNSLKLKPQTTQKNISNLLTLFKVKKSLYLHNIQNLKTKQEKINQEEIKYRQRINELIEQVNHKNLLILKHTAGLTDINIKNDKQIQIQAQEL